MTPPLSPSFADHEHLRLLEIFHYVVAGITALFASFPLLHVGLGLAIMLRPDWMKNGGEMPPALFGLFFVLLGGAFCLIGWSLAALTALSGRFLARRRHRMFSFVIAALLCAFFPFGTALGVFTVIVLSRESVQRLYAETA